MKTLCTFCLMFSSRDCLSEFITMWQGSVFFSKCRSLTHADSCLTHLRSSHECLPKEGIVNKRGSKTILDKHLTPHFPKLMPSPAESAQGQGPHMLVSIHRNFLSSDMISSEQKLKERMDKLLVTCVCVCVCVCRSATNYLIQHTHSHSHTHTLSHTGDTEGE
jgi:hypothetical protein